MNVLLFELFCLLECLFSFLIRLIVSHTMLWLINHHHHHHSNVINSEFHSSQRPWKYLGIQPPLSLNWLNPSQPELLRSRSSPTPRSIHTGSNVSRQRSKWVMLASFSTRPIAWQLVIALPFPPLLVLPMPFLKTFTYLHIALHE